MKAVSGKENEATDFLRKNRKVFLHHLQLRLCRMDREHPLPFIMDREQLKRFFFAGALRVVGSELAFGWSLNSNY